MNTNRISPLKTLCAVTLVALVAPFGIMADELPDISPKDWPTPKPKVERMDIKAQFIICMISDGEGGAFVGTEDHGVYHYDSEGNVKQYTRENTISVHKDKRPAGASPSQGAEAPHATPATVMGDSNAYALAIDKLGRLWAGNLNTGVSVFNGETWRNYDVIDGPIGERIYDIQTCPVDSDVWIATSAGITRYRIDADEWEHYTREDGLLEDQASSLAFKKDGTLIVGTQCHGLAIFNRSKNGSYKHSKRITTPERYGPGNCSPVPLVPGGSGLPTNQINQILVARDETIWIATPTGLVKSDKNLSKMQYVRGRDYADKVRGLYGGAPKEWKECPKEIMDQLMPEDYITCVTEDHNGTIWIGTRQRGFMAIDPKTGRRGTGDHSSMGMADNYVSAILPMSDGSPLIGLYIGGVIRPKEALTRGQGSDVATQNTVAKYVFAKHPSPIKPPTVEELKAMQAKLEKLNKPLPKVYAAYYGEDWKTQGDWVGRYGKQYAIMCGASAPLDQHYYFDESVFKVRPFIGPNRAKNDSLRRWVHWIKTDNSKVMYAPLNGYRRQAEWDDHAEAYPMTHNGPDLWYLLEIKNTGVYKITMYVMNKDGHSGHNRLRDYCAEIYQADRPWTKFDDWKKFSSHANAQARKGQPLAKTRIRDFWGGVHNSFAVTGPGIYYVRINKNYSFNTILSSVCIDRIHGNETSRDKRALPVMYGVHYGPPAIPESLPNALCRASHSLWKNLESKADKVGYCEIQRYYKVKTMRVAHYATNEAPPGQAIHFVLEYQKWHLNYWNVSQRQEWERAMKKAWTRLAESNPKYVSDQEKYLSTKKHPWSKWPK